MPANFGSAALVAPWLSSGPAARVLELLNGHGEEARVVGGAVRNALLRLPVADIDIATTALPAEVVRRAKAAGIKSVPTGIDHGTVTLVVDGQPFEVTTLREDTDALTVLMEEHLQLEERVLFPVAERLLSPPEQQALREEMRARRGMMP